METDNLRAAEVYARNTDFIISPSSRTLCGVWIGCSPVVRLARPVSETDLGTTIRRTLAKSRVGVPHPTDFKLLLTEFLAVAGARSWNAIQRTAAKCSIVAEATCIRVTPSKNGGTKGENRGYTPLGNLAIELRATASDEELGEAVITAFAACQ
jgi:CDI immunity protein